MGSAPSLSSGCALDKGRAPVRVVCGPRHTVDLYHLLRQRRRDEFGDIHDNLARQSFHLCIVIFCLLWCLELSIRSKDLVPHGKPFAVITIIERVVKGVVLCEQLDVQPLYDPDTLGERSRRCHDPARVAADFNKGLVHEQSMPRQHVHAEWEKHNRQDHRYRIGQDEIYRVMMKCLNGHGMTALMMSLVKKTIKDCLMRQTMSPVMKKIQNNLKIERDNREHYEWDRYQFFVLITDTVCDDVMRQHLDRRR